MIYSKLPSRPEQLRISRSLAESIGRFIVAWGFLEQELDLAFSIVFRIDGTLAHCLSANAGTKSKINSLSSGLHVLQTRLGEPLEKEAQEILDQISNYSDKARNTIAHGQFQATEELGKRWPYFYTLWEFGRNVARKSPAWVRYPKNSQYWKKQTSSVANLTRRLRTTLIQIDKTLAKFTFDEIRQSGGVTVRDHEPIVPRSRKTQPQAKGGSRGHRPKLGKP